MTKVKLIVASKNPVKVNAALTGVQMVMPSYELEVDGISVPSGVSDQPMTSEETLKGARCRAENAKNVNPNADFWFGIEGGVDKLDGEMEVFAWIYIIDKYGRNAKARTGTFYLPALVSNLVDQGIELGVADDMVFKKENSKQQGGSVGLLTNGAVDRTAYYTQAVALAMIPMINEELYFEENTEKNSTL
ncbi:inosine/xanthosine triphosphatase [Limibacter armeniacum]|uniref:inosine/xanthosine triphosphatase n=1 Tax=Limibacter armeniacum TaxID=466084 RepID=UPI002FE66F5B